MTGPKVTGYADEALILLHSGEIVPLNEYLRDRAQDSILRVGFSVARLKRWKRAFDFHMQSESQNPRFVTSR